MKSKEEIEAVIRVLESRLNRAKAGFNIALIASLEARIMALYWVLNQGTIF